MLQQDGPGSVHLDHIICAAADKQVFHSLYQNRVLVCFVLDDINHVFLRPQLHLMAFLSQLFPGQLAIQDLAQHIFLIFRIPHSQK